MSYILEALKKAQAERQLGNAPTIHAAQPVPALQPDVAASRRPLYVGLGAGALVVVVGAAFLWRAGPAQGPGAQVAQTQAPAGQVASVTAGAPAAGTPAAGLPATGSPAAGSPAAGSPAAGSPAAGSPAAGSPVSAAPAASSSLEVSAPPAPVRAPQPRVTAAAPRPAPAAARAAAPSAALPAAAPAVQVGMPTPAPAAVAAVPARAAGSPAAAPEDSLPFLQQLPASVQGGIPRVAFGGYMYSANPADRLLLVDKALRHEGEEVAPGLVLEKLLPRAAVMNYRGVRYRVAY